MNDANDEPLEREPIDRMRARLEALLKANAAPRCGARSKRAGKPCGVRPCRTGAASFMVARARGRARRRAESAACGQIGNTGTFPGKPRRNGRACGRQYLRSAICASRSNTPFKAADPLEI